MAIHFHSQNTSYNLLHKERIISWINSIFKSGSDKRLSIDFIFCNDKFLQQINEKYLQHADLTDVITFPLEESDKFLEAEVYISIDRIKENASIYSVHPDIELRRVMAHSVLHLLGYEDKDPQSKDEMRSLEDHWLAELANQLAQ